MPLLDALIVSGLVATVWVTLYLSADRVVEEARRPLPRPPRRPLARWDRARPSAARQKPRP